MHPAYRQSTRLFAVAMCGLGLAMIVSAVLRGGGALAIGVVVGVLFVGIGAGRLYLSANR